MEQSQPNSSEPTNGLTSHGKQRIKERINGKSRHSPEHQADLAWRLGLLQEQLSGAVFRWVDRRRIKYPGRILKIHRNFLFVFSMESPHKVITVYPVPKRFHAKCKRLAKKHSN